MKRNSEQNGVEPLLRAFEFPRTPHIVGSAVADDDHMMPARKLEQLCSDATVICQEKLDGTNVGVSFVREHQPACQKRAGLIGSKEKDQYNAFRNWVFHRTEILWNILGTRWVLFGEWLWQTHALYYQRLPDYFVAFDLMDRVSLRFGGSKAVAGVLNDRLPAAPILWSGTPHSSDELLSIVQRLCEAPSRFADCPPEGIYLRFERGGRLVGRAKYRRPDFRPGWHGKPRRNLLATDSRRVRHG